MAQTEPVTAPAATEDFDVSTQGDVAKLKKGAVGLGGVLFLTLTGSAPITAMLLNVPILVGSGEGLGVPGRVHRRRHRAGHLLGRVRRHVPQEDRRPAASTPTSATAWAGRSASAPGSGPLVAYGVFEASLAGGFAYFANLKLASLGVHVGWAPLALGMVVVIGVLTYFDVSFSAKILAVGLVTEVVILLIFDALLLGKGHIYWSALNPAQAFKSFPAARARASPPAARSASGCSSRSGRGSASRWPRTTARSPATPRRTSRAPLYISVIGLGIFYTLTCWASLAGYPTINAAIASAQGNAANFFFAPATAVRRPLGYLGDELPDHHRVVRLRHGVPQHDRPVRLLARPRGDAAARPRQDAPAVAVTAHRVHRGVRALADHHRAVRDLRRHRTTRRPRPTASSTA